MFINPLPVIIPLSQSSFQGEFDKILSKKPFISVQNRTQNCIYSNKPFAGIKFIITSEGAGIGMSKDFSGISGGSHWRKSGADLSPLGRPGPRAGQASTTHPNPCSPQHSLGTHPAAGSDHGARAAHMQCPQDLPVLTTTRASASLFYFPALPPPFAAVMSTRRKNSFPMQGLGDH